jgi:carboxyl-terminal processing protease
VFDATGDTITKKPLVVLVDRGTASASEITTAALHERVGAPVVGLRTIGKGVFGQVFDLSNGGALDLIVGSYYTPDGQNINGKGIKPNVPARDDPATKQDEALNKALQTLARRVSG